MNRNELIEKHKDEKCSKCKMNIDCEIHILLNNKTRCTYDELSETKQSMHREK